HIIIPDETPQSFGLTVEQAKFRLTIPDEAQEPISLADIAWFSPVDQLDLSVVRLKQQPRGASGLAIADRLPALTFASNPSNPLERLEPERLEQPRVIIIGHPLGGDLTFGFGGVLLEHDDTQLQYVADTSPGSGGSPVLDALWKVIGVHRLRGHS